ncbi:MAG: hypothetical protein PHG63_00930 [Candidatus Dojkabacteria bacterium]|nr:hypothetical protein [Candidatus Dojkabacteria bacterium]
MRQFLSRIAGTSGGLALFLSRVSSAVAQDDYLDYTYDYSYDSGAADAAAAGVFGAFWLIWCCFALLGVLLLVFRIWMLVHAIQHAPEDQKVLWIVLIVLVPFADWVYFFTKRKEWGAKKAA